MLHMVIVVYVYISVCACIPCTIYILDEGLMESFPSIITLFRPIIICALVSVNVYCYDHFFSLTMFYSCSSFLFFLVDSPLSPRTSISTDRFSPVHYVVPLTHQFPLPSLLFYDDVFLRLGQALLGPCTPFPFYINPRTSCIFSHPVHLPGPSRPAHLRQSQRPCLGWIRSQTLEMALFVDMKPARGPLTANGTVPMQHATGCCVL